MSDCSYVDTCPKCNGENLMASSGGCGDSGDCLDCGYTYWREEGQLDQEELKQLRKELGYKPKRKK